MIIPCLNIMLHRVELNEPISRSYHDRNTVIKIDVLKNLLKDLQKNKFYPAAVGEGSKKKTFHLSFDDGFKEHLSVAKYLADNFDMPAKAMTFSINVGNSLLKCYSPMDILYHLIDIDRTDLIAKIFDFDFSKQSDFFVNFKNWVYQKHPEEIKSYSNKIHLDNQYFQNLFLNEAEIIELSKVSMIGSHGIIHRRLTFYREISEIEIMKSKFELEKLISKEVEVFCYPEGRVNPQIEDFCKQAGYNWALGISSDNNSNFNIPRLCINRDYNKIIKIINE